MSSPPDERMSEFPLAGPINILTDYVPLVRLVGGIPENLLATVADIRRTNEDTGGGGGGGAVNSVFGRQGDVLAAFGDYNWNQISGSVLPPVSGAQLINLNASELRLGTVPDARFPAVLPAISGALLTNLNASELKSGTIPDARFPAVLPPMNGALITNLNASELKSGTVPDPVLANVLATPGSFTSASITVDAKGRVTAAASGPPKATANNTIGTVPYLSAANVFSDSPMIREDANTIALKTGSPTAFKLYKATSADPGKYFLIDNRNDAGGTPRWIIQGSANQFNGWDNVAIGSGGNSMVFGDSTMFPVANGGVSSSVGTTGNRVNNFYAWNTYDVRMGSSFDWTGFFWNGNTRLISYAPGSLSIDGWADNAAGSRLLFGTQAATAPMIKRNAAGLDVRLADDSNYAALAAASLRLAFSPTVYANLTTNSGGGINFATQPGQPTGQIDPAVTIRENLGQQTKKYLGIYGSDLFVETLVAQDTIATIGGRILVGPTTTLLLDVAPADTTITVKHNQISSVAPGDVLVLQVSGKIEFMLVTGGPTPATGGPPYVYTVTRNLQTTGAKQWFAGDAVFNTGRAGVGFIDLFSLYALNNVAGPIVNGPTIVGNVRNSATFNDWSEHWAIGNLNGVYGYGSNVYGVGLGKYAASASHITIDPTNGFRIFTGLSTVVGQWANDGTITLGAPVRIQFNPNGSGSLANGGISWDTAGNISIVGTAQIGGSVGGWTIATNKLSSTGIDLNSGAAAGLAFGTTPPTSASSGTGIWLDKTGLYLLNANVLQVTLNQNGITFPQESTQLGRFLKWVFASGTTTKGDADCFELSSPTSVAGGLGRIEVRARTVDTTGGGTLSLAAYNAAGLGASIGINAASASAPSSPNMGLIQMVVGVGAAKGTVYISAQNTGTPPYVDAVLDVDSTNQGMMPPRMTTAQRDAISTPRDGLMVYNSSTAALNLRAAGAWLGLNTARDVSVRVQIYSSATTVPNNTQWPVTFDFANFDTDTHFVVGSATRITIKVSGKYLLQAGVTFFGAAAGYRQLSIQINGSGTAAQTSFYAPSASQGSDLSLTVLAALNAGDYVQTIAFQNSGAGLQITTSNSNVNYSASYMSAIKIA